MVVATPFLDFIQTIGVLVPIMAQATNLSILVLVIAFIVIYISDLLKIIESRTIIAAMAFVLFCFIISYLPGRSAEDIRKVVAFGTAQRNISTALAIATLNFTNPDVMIMIIVMEIVSFILLMFIAGELGRRAKGSKENQMEEEWLK